VHAAPPAVLPLPARHFPRPRLTRLLDEVAARAIVITAPAGYGKTTLASEWLGSREHVAWYRATPASADLAVFSIGVAEAVSEFADEALRRVSQRLQVGDQPEHAVQPLAEVLADDLAEWPDDAWLAIDDYHLVMQSPTVDRFVATLLELAPIRLLVTSRRRPPWATARKLLYGEVAEIGPAQLAMDAAEATQALGDHRPEAVRALVAQAQGWPALIGMAALTSSLEVPTGRVSDMLFRYFAEEVLRQEPPEVQEFMQRAAVPASFTLASARSLLGVADLGETVERLKDEGLLHEYGGGSLAFHPLLRAFLRARLEARDPPAFAEIVEASVAAARAEQRWDDAFELASSAGRRDLMRALTDDAAAGLMASWRLETLDRWLKLCEPLDEEANLRAIRAWLLYRSDHFAEAEAHAREVINELAATDPNSSLAWRVLGGSLYSLSRYEEALEAHLHARATARTRDHRIAALWSVASTSSTLEHEALDGALAELEAIPSANPDDLLLKANARVIRATSTDSLRGVWPTVEPLLEIAGAAQPLAQLKLLGGGMYLAVSRGDYRVARNLGAQAIAVARAFRIGADLAWPLVQLATAELALRDFAAARRTIVDIEAASAKPNSVLRGLMQILWTKLALFKDGPAHVLERDARSLVQLIGVPKSIRAEYGGLVAIAASGAGEVRRARAELGRIEGESIRIESRFYPRFARLIDHCLEDGPTSEVRKAAVQLVVEAAKADFIDAFVIAYRAYPPLLRLVWNHPISHAIAVAAVTAARDQPTARSAGVRLETSAPETEFGSLTKRETEVLALLAEGFSNAEIARSLFVSHSTAKVHVHNILEKLGVKTRTQAVALAHGAVRRPVVPGDEESRRTSKWRLA
jgi:LuxR family maltose regulon positive regulatory protein